MTRTFNMWVILIYFFLIDIVLGFEDYINRQVSEQFEYPRSNGTLRKIQDKQWQKYYACLKKKYAEIGPEKITYLTSFIALEGTSIVLKCDICFSPLEADQIDIVEWYFNSSNNNNAINKLIEYTEYITLQNDKDLILNNVQVNQGGQYWCKMEDIISAIYSVHIDSDSETVNIIRPETAPIGPYETLPEVIMEYNVEVYTAWTNWSPCSVCNKVGKKIRYGYCTLSMLENYAHRYIANESAPMSDMTNQQYHKRQVRETEVGDVKLDGTTMKTDLQVLLRTILSIFNNKLPCNSKYVPKEIKNISAIKNKKIEMMVRYCKMKCPKNVVFEVRDKGNNIIESANNSAGIYSMLQKIPNIAPMVVRTVIYKKYKQELILKCPGYFDTNIPIIWKIANKILIPKLLELQSKGRIYIVMQRYINFTRLKFTDSNIYSCWQQDKLVGTIKLNITGEMEIELNYHIVILGGIIIVIVFLTVFWRAYKGQTRFTIH